MGVAAATGLSVAPEGTHLLRDGRRVLLCADTAWSAFADVAEGEWTEYLTLRRAQGFNAVQISVLPILHDRSIKAATRSPFAVRPDGTYDLDSPDPAYFAQARALTEAAVGAGLVPMLVVLWCNYVPGTWGARRTPWAPLSPEQRRGYLQLVRDTFADLQPVLVVSGDEHFHDDEPVAAYAEVLATVKELAPGCLTTLHTTPDADLPAVLAESDALDIYVYQSGHDAERQARAHELAELHLAKRRRPIMNVEPCYEAHGHGGGRGRFTDRDVRRATWWSLLGGASAGIGYGAHGVWQWHRTGATFTNAPFSMEPLTWRAALELPGAWDVGWARGVVEDAGLVGALPRQDLLRGAAHGVRLAQGEGGALAAYTPFAQAFTLSDELEVEQVVAWDLERRRRVHLDVRREADGLRVAQADTPGDLLVLVNRP